MGIITVTRGSYSEGKEIAEKVAQRSGYACISREIILEASKEFNIPEIKLMQAFEDSPSVIDRFSQKKKSYIAYTQAVLLKYFANDNVVYHGIAGHIFVEGIPHVLKILITANVAYRISTLMERDKIPENQALRLIRKIDEQRRKWAQNLYGIEPWDPTLYDLVLHIDKIGLDDAVDIICRVSGLRQFQTTPASEGAVNDLALIVKVRDLLTDIKPRADVSIQDRFLYLKPDMALGEECQLVNWMGEIMKRFPEIKGIKVLR